MVDYRKMTIDTYDRSAKALAQYFKGIGARVLDIDIAFNLLEQTSANPRVVEIGCGDGRDAVDIISRTNHYLGFDISEGMIQIARQELPDAHFEIGDAVTFEYPPNTDIVFAFASILHLDKDEVSQVLSKVHQSLNPGGVFYVSAKYMPEYKQSVKKDQYGERMFYFYNPDILKELSKGIFTSVFEDQKTIGSTDWFEIALRKA